MSDPDCLILGAGLAGLTAARELTAQGWRVLLADKGRRPGGRMATRRLGGQRFDSGAQFFTVRDARFQAEVKAWQAAGIAAPWFAEGGHTRYRGVEGMNAIAQHLARGLEVRLETRIERLHYAGGWEAGGLRAPRLLVTAPAPQALALFAAEVLPAAVREALAAIEFEPTLALLIRSSEPARVGERGYLRDAGILATVADQAAKGMASGGALTVHADAEFSRRHYETPESQVTALLLEAAREFVGGEVLETYLHRWRYATPVRLHPEPCLAAFAPGPAVFAGDAFSGPRVEGAFLSGLAAAQALLAM